MTANSACSSLSRICVGVPAGRKTPYQFSITHARQAELLGRRQIGQQRRAFRGEQRDRLDRAGLHQRQQHRQIGIEHVDMAAEQIVDRRRGAAIGHVGDFHAGGIVEHFDRDVHGRARPRRAVGELLRLRLGDEVFHGGDAELVVHHQKRRHGGDHHHRLEGFHRIVGRRRLEDRAQDLRSHAGEQDRVAVGRRVRDQFGADGAAGAAAIVDDHVGLKLRRQFGRRMRAN